MPTTFESAVDGWGLPLVKAGEFLVYCQSIRVDLGNKLFVEAKAPSRPMLKGSSAAEVATALVTFIKSREGQIAQVNRESVSFDTMDLTCVVALDALELTEADLDAWESVLKKAKLV